MTHARRMIEANPTPAQVDAATLSECIEACFDCAQTCTACADACLGEQHPNHLARCIRLDLDCRPVRGRRQGPLAPDGLRAGDGAGRPFWPARSRAAGAATSARNTPAT